MSQIPVHAMADAAQWVAAQADGVTPSTDLAVHDETVVVGDGPDGVSLRVTATANATGHTLRRTIPAVDISDHPELRLSIRADRAAGAGGAPFFLELRLGSTAVPLSDPNNHWHRLLPVRRTRTWEVTRLSTDDLAPGVASGLSAIQVRCVDASRPFTAYLDDLVAVSPQMLADADRAFEDRLTGITVGGAPAPAAVRAPAQPAPAAPALDILQIEVRYAPARVRDGQRLRDFTTEGARLASPGVPYDVDYSVSAVAATRDAQAALIEAVLGRIAPVDELVVAGDRLPVELVWIARRDRPHSAAADIPVLHYRVGVRGRSVAGPPVRDVSELLLTVDHRETA
jgi:hypothetical protein